MLIKAKEKSRNGAWVGRRCLVGVEGGGKR